MNLNKLNWTEFLASFWAFPNGRTTQTQKMTSNCLIIWAHKAWKWKSYMMWFAIKIKVISWEPRVVDETPFLFHAIYFIMLLIVCHCPHHIVIFIWSRILYRHAIISIIIAGIVDCWWWAVLDVCEIKFFFRASPLEENIFECFLNELNFLRLGAPGYWDIVIMIRGNFMLNWFFDVLKGWILSFVIILSYWDHFEERLLITEFKIVLKLLWILRSSSS